MWKFDKHQELLIWTPNHGALIIKTPAKRTPNAKKQPYCAPAYQILVLHVRSLIKKALVDAGFFIGILLHRAQGFFIRFLQYSALFKRWFCICFMICHRVGPLKKDLDDLPFPCIRARVLHILRPMHDSRVQERFYTPKLQTLNLDPRVYYTEITLFSVYFEVFYT